MKFKVKGLVFVGFAAAILSAGAYADDTNTVTSKAYTDATYAVKSTSTTKFQVGQKSSSDNSQTWADLDTKVTGVNNDYVSVGANATTGGVEIKMDSNQVTGSYDAAAWNGANSSGTASNLVTEAAVQGAIAALGTTAGNTYQPKTQNKIQVATVDPSNNNAPTWTGMTNAVKEVSGGYVDVSAEAGNTGAIEVNLDPSMIHSYDSTTASNNTTLTDASSKLITEGVLKANLALKEDAANKNASSTDAQSNPISNLDTTSDTKFPTSKSVALYVSEQMGGYTLPEMPSTCKAANTHCALVASGDGNNGVTMAWTVMAQAQ